MVDCVDCSSVPYKVLVSSQGRHGLWPAHKPIPAGWSETMGPRPRAECLEFVERAWSSLRVRPRRQRRTIDFGLFFFGSDEGTNARDKYELVIEAARFADANGFTAVWLPERHFTRMGSLYPNPAVLHAALARETRRICLRSGSVVLPLHDPIRVAEEWAVVDNLSGGRVELSFAPGWHAEDFVLRPDHYAKRYEVLYESIRTVQRLWSGATIEGVDGAGRPIQARTYPTPVQKELVTWITAAGSVQSFQQAGRIGANLLTHLFDQDIDELADKIALYRRAREQHGWDPEAGRVAVALHSFLADTAEEVHQQAFGAYRDYLKANVKMLASLCSRNIPLDITSLAPAELDAAIEWLYDKFLRDRSLLGTVATCEELAIRLAAIGVQEIACLVDFGPTAAAIMASLPKLRDLMTRSQALLARDG